MFLFRWTVLSWGLLQLVGWFLLGLLKVIFLFSPFLRGLLVFFFFFFWGGVLKQIQVLDRFCVFVSVNGFYLGEFDSVDWLVSLGWFFSWVSVDWLVCWWDDFFLGFQLIGWFVGGMIFFFLFQLIGWFLWDDFFLGFQLIGWFVGGMIFFYVSVDWLVSLGWFFSWVSVDWLVCWWDDFGPGMFFAFFWCSFTLGLVNILGPGMGSSKEKPSCARRFVRGRLIDEVVFHAFQIFDLNGGTSAECFGPCRPPPRRSFWDS